MPFTKSTKNFDKTFHWSLSYGHYLQNIASKTNARSSVLKIWLVTNGAQTITSPTHLPFPQCASKQARCAHTTQVDVRLSKCVRLTSGSIKSSHPELLPISQGITSPRAFQINFSKGYEDQYRALERKDERKMRCTLNQNTTGNTAGKQERWRVK